MNAVKAVWKNGRIEPVEPIEWPEGMELVVEPIMPRADKIGLDEADWPDDPESLADWAAWIRTVEPAELTDDERALFARYREECRRHNLDAMRQRMEIGEEP